MTQKLDAILGALHSDKARLDFLKSIYTPGNIEVADRILSKRESSSVIENEIEYAKQTGNKERFKQMAKKYIDYYVNNGHDVLLKDPIIGWNDSELADYAIRQMYSKSEKDKGIKYSLEYAAEIAQAFGKKETEKKLLERLLTSQERDKEFKFSAANTLIKLGRFEEAINRYLEAGHEHCAFDLAKEHAPAKAKKIAETVFRKFKPGSDSAKLYVECAEVLGRTKEAEKTLVKYAKRVKVDKWPRCYEDVVKSLVKFEHNKEAKNLTTKIAKHELCAGKGSIYYGCFDHSIELAELYHIIGDTETVKKIYMGQIKKRIKENHHPSNALNEIKKAIELTGDMSFREKELEIYEKEKEYERAASLAGELGKTELAKTYSEMHAMIQAAKGKQI